MADQQISGLAAEQYQRAARQIAQTMPGAPRLRLTVIGDSMRPVLRAGDVVVVQPQEAHTLQVGQIIVVQHGGEWITHRLQAVDAAGWHTHGDNTRIRDAAATAADIIGRVVAVERAAEQGGRTIDLLAAPWADAGPRIVRVQHAQLWLLDQARRLRPRWLDTHAGNLIAAGLSWPFTGMTRFLIWLTVRQSLSQRQSKGHT
jgi:hypothetical protein